MTISSRKITAFAKTIAGLADVPSLASSTLLKQWFDSSPEELRVAFSGLIDDLLATTTGASGSENIGSAPISGVAGATAYAQLVDLKAQLMSIVLGQIPDGSLTDVKLDNGATSVKAKANAAAPKASPQFTGLVKSTNNTLDDGAGGSLFQGNTNATTSMVLRNLNAGSSALSIFQIGNDTAANRLVLFSNSSTRTADGGVGNSTIRTDSGSLNLGANGWTNIVLNVDQSTTINGALTINGAGGSFANSKAASGYQKLPGGLIIQWGTISVASGTIVSYPISFPTAIASVTVTCGTASPFAASANTGSLASFVLYHGNGATATLMNWMAIGY